MQQTAISELPTDKGRRKREAFKKLAERRTNAILDRIRILGNLANRSAYDYSENDIRRIFGAIEEELRGVKAKFRATGRRTFRLG